jgi:UDP-MurNAc hydroxylase
LGHAGFCVETEESVVVMDPWLSPEGAFDSAWFQFPRNHHLASFVREKLADPGKERFIYISHEHQDHFDRKFLGTLDCSEITFVVPRFQRAALRNAVAAYQAKAVITCDHEDAIPIPGGYLKLYLEDSGLNRDSAILVNAEGQSFLNLNDCKLYDELAAIVRREDPISVFACQFSGATWHPICYDYPQAERERISRQKVDSKFETVARALEIVKPRVYIPSAGPPCFLDPTLMHLNFERLNVFPRAAKFLSYLCPRLAGGSTQALNMTPGDVLDVESGQIVAEGTERPTEENLREYLSSYAKQYACKFAEWQEKPSEQKLCVLLDRLRDALERKLSKLTLNERVNVPLYFGFSDASSYMVRVDFPRRIVARVTGISDQNYYSLAAPSWQVGRILDGKITWEDFALTFRMRLNRSPDVYQTLIQGFLLMEPEDMNWLCARLQEIEQRRKRTIVEAGGTRYSIDRYCPHGGADLSQGWSEGNGFWVCPRHRWQFALDKAGQCVANNASVNAVCLESDP